MTIELKNQVRDKINRVLNSLQSDSWYTKPGWGQRPKMEPDAWTTAEIIYIFNELRKLQILSPKTELIPEAINFILSQQHKQSESPESSEFLGGWGLERSSPPNTAFILMVLSSKSNDHTKVIEEGLNYLLKSKHYGKDLGRGGWAIIQGLESNILVTNFVIVCLYHVQNNIGPNMIRLEHLEPARIFILENMNEDGGWGETFSDESDAKPTAYSVWGLTTVFKNNKASIQAVNKGKKWLKRNFNIRKGCWGVSGDIEATAMAVWALLEAGEHPASKFITRPIEYLLESSHSDKEVTGWGIYANEEQVETWITFYVLMAFIKYLEVVENTKEASFFQKTEMFLSNQVVSNILIILFLVITLALFSFSVSASDTTRETLLKISGALSGLLVIAQILYRMSKNN